MECRQRENGANRKIKVGVNVAKNLCKWRRMYTIK
jgi:hypothetical protein